MLEGAAKASADVDAFENSRYIASIKVFGKIYSSTGATALEALTNLKPLGTPKAMSIVSVSRGEVKKDRILPPMRTWRLFTPSRVMREVALKQLAVMFDGI